MSQPNLIQMRSDRKIALTVFFLMILCILGLFSACAESELSKVDRSIEMVIVSHASTWGGGTEVEVERGSEEGSILKLNSDSDALFGSGKRTTFKVLSDQFDRIHAALRPMEERAMDTDNIEDIDILEYDDSLGFDCKNRITDVSFVRVIWVYSDRSASWATYYTGCDNKFSKTISRFLKTEFDMIEPDVEESNWITSSTRMDDFFP